MAGYGRGSHRNFDSVAGERIAQDESRERYGMARQNIAMLLEYDGTRYDGWQRQRNTDCTIQGKLESVLERMTGTYQEVHGSGRTDAGVHASGQVANVHLDTVMKQGDICDYLNRYLPEDIRILKTAQVSERFHSRLWAT